MSKELFDQEFAAKFTSMEGRVYPFDREKDMGEVPYQENLPNYCSMDFGFRCRLYYGFKLSRKTVIGILTLLMK